MKNKIVCYFSRAQADQPIIYRLVKDFDLIVNILKADINPNKEGILVIELDGPKAQYENGVKYLEDMNIAYEPLSESITWNEDMCIQCGSCAAFCPTAALNMDADTMLVSFDNNNCVVCGMCVACCPANAIKIIFELPSRE